MDGNYGLLLFGTFVTSYELLNFLMFGLENFKLECLLNTYVSSIKDKRISVVSKKLGKIDIDFEILVIATGSKQVLNLDDYICNEDVFEFLSTGIFFQKNISLYGLLLSKDVLIMGSGSRELFLAKRVILEGGSVKGIIEREDKIVCNDLNLINFMKIHNIKIYLNSNIKKITKTHLVFQDYLDVVINIENKMYKNILCGKIICPFKYSPETRFLNNFVELGEREEVVVNDKFMTNKEGVFAIGNSCNMCVNSDSIYADSIYLADVICDFLNKKSESSNVKIDYDVNIVELANPKYITKDKNKKHITFLLNCKNISESIKILVNGEKFLDFKILKFENYIEILLNLENYVEDIKSLSVLFE